MPELPPKVLHALVHGRVQGVGFRAFVAHHAQELHLTGWVRNTSDGDVEVLAEGDESDLQILLGYLSSGPRGSWVSAVDSDWESSERAYNSFFVAATD